MSSLAAYSSKNFAIFSLNTGYSLRLSTLRKPEVNEPKFSIPMLSISYLRTNQQLLFDFGTQKIFGIGDIIRISSSCR
jgi:hypothetical protein